MAVIANFSSLLEIGFALNVAGAVYYDGFFEFASSRDRIKRLRRQIYIDICVERYRAMALRRLRRNFQPVNDAIRLVSEAWMGLCCLIILYTLTKASFDPSYSFDDGSMRQYLAFIVFGPLLLGLAGFLIGVSFTLIQHMVASAKTDAVVRKIAKRDADLGIAHSAS